MKTCINATNIILKIDFYIITLNHFNFKQLKVKLLINEKMKNSKLSIAAIVIFALTSIVSKAQNLSGISDSKNQEMVEQMKLAQQKLQLSEEQKIKFKEISRNYAEKMKSLRDSKEQRLAKLKQLKSIQMAKDAEMKILLSETQYNTYLELKAERKGRLKERRNR